MAVPWLTVLKALEQAALHVQVQVESVERASDVRANATGTIVRVFKGDSSIIGEPVTVSLACFGPAGEMEIGGDSYASLEDLQDTRVMEVFLDEFSWNPIAPPFSHSVPLDDPSDAPVFDLPAELETAREAGRQGAKQWRAKRRTEAVAAVVGIGGTVAATTGWST